MHSTIFFILPLVLSTIIPANLDLKAKTVGAGTQAAETKRDVQTAQSNDANNVYHSKREFKSVVLGDVKNKIVRDSINANELI